ncbi:hypothetical protein SAMN05216184_1178 [Georgenia satyanarayanai]|uniref:Uncharacterized protein n=1 Tax=Georgenia satyanarayanai TaxID=860221 RepID=A0A2Y9AQP5_9MICO|nr:hypothetical protein [Georgenia satyanarayanai]PYF96790.1 hypothetical protein A8987_1178 [Georgenia satyanarayanai]SSA46386.1 hypothetical protein SAMN05216184_1178 [Georgenia satyanarayanai]
MRPVDWSPVWPTDPVPGDPPQVLSRGQDYSRVAEAIAVAVTALRAIADVDSRSEAVEALRSTATEVADRVAVAEDRYREVGEALRAYAPVLDQAQQDSYLALLDGRQAHDDEVRHLERLSTLGDQVVPEEQQSGHAVLVEDTASLLEDARGRLEMARTRIRDAVEARDQAAAAAAARIEDVVEGDGLSDGWRENLRQLGRGTMAVIEGIATWGGLAALALGWIPVIGPILSTVALLAGAVVLIRDIADVARGEGSWTNVALGALGLATLGVGRVAASAFRTGVTALPGVARGAAGRMAATSNAHRAMHGVTRGSAQRAVRSMVGPRIAGMSRAQGRSLAAPLRGGRRVWNVRRDLASAGRSILDDARQVVAPRWSDLTRRLDDVSDAVRGGQWQTVAPRMTGQHDDLQALAELRGIGTRNAGLPQFADFTTHLRDTQLAQVTMGGAFGADVAVQGYGVYHDATHPAPVTP